VSPSSDKELIEAIPDLVFHELMRSKEPCRAVIYHLFTPKEYEPMEDDPESVRWDAIWDSILESSEGRGPAPTCDHCASNVIQGILCHEHGCPVAPRICRLCRDTFTPESPGRATAICSDCANDETRVSDD